MSRPRQALLLRRPKPGPGHPLSSLDFALASGFHSRPLSTSHTAARAVYLKHFPRPLHRCPAPTARPHPRESSGALPLDAKTFSGIRRHSLKICFGGKPPVSLIRAQNLSSGSRSSFVICEADVKNCILALVAGFRIRVHCRMGVEMMAFCFFHTLPGVIALEKSS